jgi:tRNA (cmo5U34)-methyltransferase
MSAQFHWDPASYLEVIRAEVPRFDELQAAAIAAVPGRPERVLDHGVGTGETARRRIEAYPGIEICGHDSSPEMIFRARELGIDVRLARMEDPLPDGPWDLVIAVLSVHHLESGGKRDLFRRVREQAGALVLGDVVQVSEPVTPIDPDFDFPDRAEEIAEWCDGTVRWSEDDLAVIVAEYA